jgi:hypothetical protein
MFEIADYQLHAIASGVSASVLVLIAECCIYFLWKKRKCILRHFHAKHDQLTRKRISDREKRLCAFYGRIANEKRLENQK